MKVADGRFAGRRTPDGVRADLMRRKRFELGSSQPGAGTGAPGKMSKSFFKIAQSEEKNSATLTVCVDALEVYHVEAFAEACDDLAATDRKHLIVDLRRLHNLRSRFIGLVIKLADEVGAKGVKLAVIASPRIVQMLELFASDVGLELKTVETEKAE
jgi:anti-anti-sigma regulatory factor